MTAIPAIYDTLTASQKAAYSDWMDWTVEKEQHVVDCTEGCDIQMMRCLSGMFFAEAERTAYAVFRDSRRATSRVQEVGADSLGRRWYRVRCSGCDSGAIEGMDRAALESGRPCLLCEARTVGVPACC